MPELAWRLRLSETWVVVEVARLIGETGRLGTMKGLEASAAFMPWVDAVKGVLVSERERWRLPVGVFGGYAITRRQPEASEEESNEREKGGGEDGGGERESGIRRFSHPNSTTRLAPEHTQQARATRRIM